jgi:hypothetical protein
MRLSPMARVLKSVLGKKLKGCSVEQPEYRDDEAGEAAGMATYQAVPSRSDCGQSQDHFTRQGDDSAAGP